MLAVLALLAVIGLYTAATMHEALLGTVLAGSRVAQQRAFVLADGGIESTLRDLAANSVPLEVARVLATPPGPDQVTVTARVTAEDTLPEGFSAGRFVLRRFEIRSVGQAARGARSVQVQGASRIEPLTAGHP